MSKVIITQGPSGSGKSTYIKNNYPNAKVFSADHCFMIADKYCFDPTKLGEAHKTCLRKFTNEIIKLVSASNTLFPMLESDSVLVVDNTNTQLWEMSPYIQIAAAYGFSVEVIRCKCDTAKAAARNTHGVPAKAVEAMAARMQSPLPFWACSFKEVNTD